MQRLRNGDHLLVRAQSTRKTCLHWIKEQPEWARWHQTLKLPHLRTTWADHVRWLIIIRMHKIKLAYSSDSQTLYNHLPEIIQQQLETLGLQIFRDLESRKYKQLPLNYLVCSTPVVLKREQDRLVTGLPWRWPFRIINCCKVKGNQWSRGRRGMSKPRL